MDVPYTWRPTGWFQIGWSSDFPSDRAVPLRYFGEDLAAYRDSNGELHILEAHCPHFGAHIGHGGTVEGDCVTCPYHGWVWSPEGENVSIPYQDTPNRSKSLRVWPVVEQYGSVYLWHHPNGAGVGWEMPDIFKSFPQFETDPNAYYAPMTAKATGEPVHPQVVAENGPDSAHFQFVHRATVAPVALDWNPDGPIWKFLTGWPDPKAPDGDTMALKIHSWLAGLGGSLTAFEGSQNHRLTFTITPVEKGRSDMFYTVWWPRPPGEQDSEPPAEVKAMIDKQFLSTMEDDLEIWRYQRYIVNPALAKQDAKPYKALRKWANQFYDIPPEN